MPGHRERTSAYEVAPGAVLPGMIGVPGVTSLAEPVVHGLTETYFDTPDRRLAQHEIGLCRRAGGEDEGWRVKHPAGGDGATVLQQPSGRRTRTVPRAVADLVRVHVRDEPLAPVAIVRSRRIVHRLLDADGAVLAEVSDDDVRAEALGRHARTTQWREWEVVLVGGDPALQDAVQRLLVSAGATASTGAPALWPTLGLHTQGPLPQVRRRSAAGDAVTAVLREQVQALVWGEPAVRANEPDAVHQARVTVRTLRSLLDTYRPLLERSVTDPVRGELRWFGGVLGAARDAEVSQATCAELLAGEPAGLVLGPVANRLADTLEATHARATVAVVTELDAARWFRLLDALDELLADPPLTRAADGRADQVLARCVSHDEKRLRRIVSALGEAGSAGERTALMHEVRKAAKRLRYAAESAERVCGRPARRTARAATQAQKVLGTLQDAALTRQVLRDVAAAAGAAGEPTFTYGRLDARAEATTTDVEPRFARAWDELNRSTLRRWLRG